MLETTANIDAITNRKTTYKKKLIEVALPLQAINAASAREKSIRHGHPSTLHLWWARRPLAACRAVLFASLVDDPSSNPAGFPTVEEQAKERQRLFGMIEDLVKWENSLDQRLLSAARSEIHRSVGDALLTAYDPFCGGGAIPIEAQRFGLPTLASDLNPVAVLITKALVEIPWRFRGRPPVHPNLRGPLSTPTWERATGLAADVEAYGATMFERARKVLDASYPRATLDDGHKATVISWVWARTVKCANPLCGTLTPLVRSFTLSNRAGHQWSIAPIIERDSKTVRFSIVQGVATANGTVNRTGAQCIVCDGPMTLAYVRTEGRAGRLGTRLMAMVADGRNGRVYLPPLAAHEHTAMGAKPSWEPDTDLPDKALGFRVQAYGMTKHRDLFTSRQLLALTTFSDLVRTMRDDVLADATNAGVSDDGRSLESGGEGATAYADALATYLALSVDRLADYCSSLCLWNQGREQVAHVFGRQTISMTWDFAEVNPLSDSSGNFGGAVAWVQKVIAAASVGAEATVWARDAADGSPYTVSVMCTDPPYYDNVPYADLSDFFYVWLRASLRGVYPDLLATLLVPKKQELVADVARFDGSRPRAQSFFEQGLARAFESMRQAVVPGVPATIFYAFKQTEAAAGADDHNGVATRSHASTGWETMLTALLGAGFQITGTWPLTSERPVRLRSIDSNALASSIVLVCRPRPEDAGRCSRADFVRELRADLPLSVQRLRDASLAATDLQQAALGPGMAAFSQHSQVLEPDDSPMSVRSALALINEELAQILLGEIADVDAETHFALSWFDRYGYGSGKYGDADILLKAKNANLRQLEDAGVVFSERGQVRLLAPTELPVAHTRVSERPTWAQCMFLIAALMSEEGGEALAADVLRAIDASRTARLKDIAYHCYLICDRQKRAADARDFNALVAAWPEIERRAGEIPEGRLL